MAVELQSKTARRKLLPRREPYWHRLVAGFHIGYRVLVQGDGTWIARKTESTKKTYQALGTFDDFDEAVKTAYAWKASVEAGVVKFDATVEDACNDYLADIKSRKGEKAAKDVKGRFCRLVFDTPLAKVPLSKLTPKMLRDWLNAQVVEPDADAAEDEEEDELIRRSKDSANRNLRTLKAALNLARRDGSIQTDFAWVGVKQFEGVGARREGVLSREQRELLINHCRDDFRLFVQALLLTGARPGEMAGVVVADVDVVHGTIGLSGKTGRRTVALSTQACNFFASVVAGRSSADCVFVNSWGNAWTKDTWKEQFRAAAKEAGFTQGFVVYHLRHTAISEMLLAGLSPGIVAQLTGTSIEMISRHYGHLFNKHTRELLDKVKLI